MMVEELLEFLVTEVDADLSKRVELEDLDPKRKKVRSYIIDMYIMQNIVKCI